MILMNTWLQWEYQMNNLDSVSAVLNVVGDTLSLLLVLLVVFSVLGLMAKVWEIHKDMKNSPSMRKLRQAKPRKQTTMKPRRHHCF